MSSSNDKTGSTLGTSRGESPSTKNGFVDSRSNCQIIKEGGWKSMYHMMFHCNLDPTKDEDWQEAKRIVEGVRQGDMDQARAEAAERERDTKDGDDRGSHDMYARDANDYERRRYDIDFQHPGYSVGVQNRGLEPDYPARCHSNFQLSEKPEKDTRQLDNTVDDEERDYTGSWKAGKDAEGDGDHDDEYCDDDNDDDDDEDYDDEDYDDEDYDDGGGDDGACGSDDYEDY